MKTLRRYRQLLNSLLAFLVVFWQICQPLQAATITWTGTTDATWSTATNWSAGVPTGADDAIFGSPIPGTGGTLTLGAGSLANSLSFRENYTLNGGELALGAGGIRVEAGRLAVLNTQLNGTQGLLLTGGGSLRLGNISNSYTGATTIANGSLIISSGGALGTDASAISILTTNQTPLNTSLYGFGGGSLVLDGLAAGFTLARDINLEGRGPMGERGSAVLSLGNNVLSGIVSTAVSPLPLSPTATLRNSRISSVNGNLTLSGTLNAGGTAVTTYTNLGGVNGAGSGHFTLSGVLSGPGSIEKSGGGTLFLNPSDVSGYTGTFRVSASGTGQESTLRVTQLLAGTTSVFGASAGTTTNAAIDLNGGILEFRADGDLNFGALATGKNIYTRSTGILFTGPAAGGTSINGVTTLGALHQNASGTAGTNTTTFNSRNGYGVTLSTLASDASTSTASITTTLANNLGGELRFTGNLTLPEGSASSRPRVLSFSGNGNTLVESSILAGTDTGKTLTKAGTGSLTIRGTGTTVAGAISINGGAIIATDFRSLNNNTATLNIGTSGTAGALIIGTSAAATSAGLTTSKVINLAGTTGTASIYANQSGANPVVLNANFTATGAGSKLLVLGGSNTANNLISGSIVNNSGTNVTSLTKVGAGAWVLAGANTYTGTTTISNGVIRIRANAATSTVLPATNAITFGATSGYAGATLEFQGQSGANNVQNLGTLVYAGAGAHTLRLTPGAGGTASLTFANITTGGAGTINIVGADFTANKVTFTQVNAAAGSDGILTRSVFWNGADYAFRQGGVLRAPNYGVDAGTSTTAAGPLTAASNVQITGSFATNTVSVSTLKINGSQTLTINAGQTLTLAGGGLLASGGNAIVTGGTLALGSQALVVRANLASDVLTVDSPITGTGGLTKSGAGVLILGGANTRTGATEIAEGIVRLSGAGTLSGTGVATNIRQLGVLDLNGVGSGTAIGLFTNNGIVTNSSPVAAVLTIGNNNGTGTSYGVIQDGAGLVHVTKVGTGGHSWLGNSTYTGVTTLGGTGLVTVDRLANGGQASGIGASSSDAANLVFNGSTAGLVYQGNITEGILTLGSRSATTDRLFTLAGTGATLSSTASNNNAIIWSNTGDIAHGVVGPQTLILTGTSGADNTFNPRLTDSGTDANVTSLTKTGTGQWNLGNANNTYTGTTTVANGTLAINQGGALPANSPLVLGSTTTSGILQVSGIFTRNLAATAAAGAGTITWGGTTGGGGFAAHSTPLTVTLNGGAGLTWGSGGFVGSGGIQALLFGSASALADVTFTNAIDLAGAVRTVTVTGNTTTGAEFATLSGVLSGVGGGLSKTGNGILRLGPSNTYTGTTAVEGGTLVVSSLGGSTGPASSSVGAGGVAMDDTNAIVLGNASTTGGILQYVGPGETSDRKIRLRGTTASNQIHADGSGPLILTNVAHDTTETGAKTLFLRGSNAAGNMITSQLSDNAGGVLSVTIDGGATWILTNPANNYSGTTTVGAGALGLGHDMAVPAALTVSNANVFAYGGDRAFANAFNFAVNTNSGFLGDYSLTLNGVNTLAGTGTTSLTINTFNSIAAGKVLTLNGLTTAAGANRPWTLDGPGETVVNGTFVSTTAFGVNIVKTGNGTLTLGTDGTTSSWNKAGNALDIDRGTLKFAANDAIPTRFANLSPATSAATPISTSIYTVTSTEGLQVGQPFTGTNVPAGSFIVSIDSATQFTASAATTAEVTAATTLSFLAGSGLTLSPELATADTVTVNLNGTSQTINALTATTDGTVILDNTSSTAAAFRFGANNSAVSFGTGVGTYTIQNTGSGAMDLVKLGNATAAFSTGVTVGNKGQIASLGGGIFSIAGPVTAATSLRAVEASTLALTGGITNPSLITSLEVGGGSTLSLLDGAGSLLNLGNLRLGNTGTGTVTLNLNVGDAATDTLTLLTTGTLQLGNTVTFNMTDAGLSANTTYTLLNLVDGGLTAFGSGNLIQGGTPGGFTSMTWNVTDNLVQLTTGNLILGDLYWRGATNNAWNGNVNNWSQNKDGTGVPLSIPGAGNNVIFAWDNPGAAALTTTLEQNIKINSLVFEAGATSTPVSVAINPGTIATNRLEIAPQLATSGIEMKAGGPDAVSVGASLKLGASQTWSIADANDVLTLAGSLQGQANVTKAGPGKVILTAAADPSFNAAETSVFTITAGNLEFTQSGALGTTANSNVASIVVNGGGFFYNNATAGTAATLPHAITLNGGTLSGAGANHTYGGPVVISGASGINMAEANGPATNTVRNITLSGAVSGTGSLLIDSNSTDSGGNQLGGTLTINNAAGSWSGNLALNRGTVTIAAAASPTVAPANVTFNSFGRLILQGVDGQTLNRAAGLTYAAGAVGEFQVDNTTTTQATNFTVNQNGIVTLGGGGIGASMRIALPDAFATMNINGAVTLGGNSSISVSNSAARLLTIAGVIDDGVGSYSLAINDDAGGWAQTNGTVRLDAANTYDGGTLLASGTLLLGHKSALSTGALTASGASTLSSLVDLTGADSLANALNLNAVLTFAGSNGFTFNGLTSNIGVGGITNSLTAGNLLFSQVNLAEPAASAARTLTVAGAGTGTTTVTALLNNLQNNTLTNNLSGAPLSIGSIALSESAGTGRTLTLGGTGTTVVTGLIENVLGGGGTAGTLAKADAGLLTLQGANTFTGPVSISAGILEFSTVTDAGGGASNLGSGPSLSMAGGTLRFIGTVNQSTNRPITLTAGATLAAFGTAGASITYSGAVGTAGSTLTLSGADASSLGSILGGITQTGTAADLSVNSGNWTLSGAASVLADDIIVTNASAVLNLNGASLVSFTTGTSNGLYARAGATINLLSNDVFGPANSGSLDFILLGDNSVGGATLNMGSFGLTSPRLDLGQTTAGYTADIIGSGTLSVTTNFNLYAGSISAKLAGAGAVAKFGLGTVRLSGDNSGLTSATAVRIDAGVLELDYTGNQAVKLRAATGLDMRGGALLVTGNNSASTAVTVASLTLASGGSSRITVNPGTGQTAVLNLGAITRAAGAGTLRVNLPSGVQDATNGIVTTAALNSNGTLPGYLTVNDGTGIYFATKNATNNVVAVASTTKTDISTWLNGENVNNTGGAYTGTTGLRSINSLTFDSASNGAVTIANLATLDILSGGVLLTSAVNAGSHSITGGRLTSGIADLVFIHEGSVELNVSSVIGLTHAVTKTGNGTLRLTNGLNTFTGSVNIHAGTLQVAGGNAIGDTSLVTLSDDQVNTFQLLANETIGGLAGGNNAAGLVVGTVALGTHSLRINSTANRTYAGVFTGSGTITLAGASGLGNLQLTGNSGSGFTGALVVNGGMMYLEGAATMDAASLTINRGGSFLISNNGTTRSGTRFPDGMPILLNSADGSWNGETRPSGLSIRTDQAATTNETVGVLTFGSGANYFRGDAGGTTGVAGLITSNLVRLNGATLNARGRNLGATTGDRNFLRIVSASANETSFAATLVGGGGAAGSKNLSIVPWAIGQTQDANVTDPIMGNSLLTYVVAAGSGAGFRPLDLVTEYNTFATRATATDNLRENLTTSLTGLAGTTINALVINNANTTAGSLNVSGSGAGQTLAITAGTLLFTATSATTGNPAMGITLDGFDGGITTGAGAEYIVFVQNPTSATAGGLVTATIASPLTTAADITKSGRGVLVLSGVNTAGGGAKRTTLNEGVLEIADLDNIGGGTGALVFAGGTLRLGAGFTDDLSTRSITFLEGGGTLDTNGVDLALAGSLGTGTGPFTKTGAGTLTLGVTSVLTHTVTVAGGTLAVGANNATGAGPLVVTSGGTLDIGIRNLSHPTITTSGASPVISGTGTLTASTAFIFNSTGDSVLNAILAGAAGLWKSQADVLALNGISTYTGGTEIQNGTLAAAVLANAGVASSLGAPAAGTDAAFIRMGLGTNATGLSYVGAVNASTNRVVALQGTTGEATLSGNGAGAIDFTAGATGYNSGAKTLILSGGSASGVINRITSVANGIAILSLAKTGTNVWELYGSNSYTGATQVDNGVLRIGAENAVPVVSSLRIGNGATAGVFDMNGFNQTVAGLTAVSTSNTVTGQIAVGAGRTLTITGNINLGSSAATSVTQFASTGGAWVVNNTTNTGNTFLVGGTGSSNTTTADLSGLASLTATLNDTAGVLLVGSSSGTNSTGQATLTLAPITSITASAVTIGGGGTYNGTLGQVNRLNLGSTSTALNVNALNIGTGARDLGSLGFLGASGTLTVRAADGVSAAAFNMGTGTAVTGVALAGNQNTFDVTGHTADLKFSTVSIGTQNRNADLLNVFSFDTGTLEIGSLNASSKGSNGFLTTTILNIGGGTVTSGAWTLGSASGAGNAEATANLTGGSLTFSGSILSGNDAVGGGTVTATVNLNGAALNMGSQTIGSATNPVTFSALSGSLTNLAELNGGGLLTKSTAGVLTLGNGNTYTGGTTVSAGTLVAANSSGSATGAGAVTVSSGATLAGNGFLAPASNTSITVDGTLLVGSTGDTVAQKLTVTTTGTGLTTVNGVVAFDLFGGQGSGTLNAQTGNNDQLVVSGTSGFTLGATSTLQVSTSLPITEGTWAVGTEWKLFDWSGLSGGVNGTFSNLSSPAPFNYVNLPDLSTIGLAWDVSNLYTAGTILVVVPEPGRMLLVFLGLLGLCFRRRR